MSNVVRRRFDAPSRAFTDRSGAGAKPVAVTHPNIGSEELRAFVRSYLESVCRELKRGQTYTAKQLFGAELWGVLVGGERNVVGRCVAYLVTTKALPLVAVGRNNANHCLYRVL